MTDRPKLQKSCLGHWRVDPKLPEKCKFHVEARHRLARAAEARQSVHETQAGLFRHLPVYSLFLIDQALKISTKPQRSPIDRKIDMR